MDSKCTTRLIAVFTLAIFWTPVTSFGHSDSRPAGDGSYEKTEREYVLSAKRTVEARCELGDTLVKGLCFGENRLVLPGEREYGVVLESIELNSGDTRGWSCRPRVVHPKQVIRVESTVVCKKNSQASN